MRDSQLTKQKTSRQKSKINKILAIQSIAVSLRKSSFSKDPA